MDPAVAAHRRLELGFPVSAASAGEQMFHPIFDPFDRTPGEARARRHQRHVGIDHCLDAEAAADVLRHHDAKLVFWHAQGARHHRHK